MDPNRKDTLMKVMKDARVKQSGGVFWLDLAALQAGDVVTIKTLNSTYRAELKNPKNGEASITRDGTGFRPTNGEIVGGTKHKLLPPNISLQFPLYIARSGKRNDIRTSQVQRVLVNGVQILPPLDS